MNLDQYHGLTVFQSVPIQELLSLISFSWTFRLFPIFSLHKQWQTRPLTSGTLTACFLKVTLSQFSAWCCPCPGSTPPLRPELCSTFKIQSMDGRIIWYPADHVTFITLSLHQPEGHAHRVAGRAQESWHRYRTYLLRNSQALKHWESAMGPWPPAPPVLKMF